MKIKRLYVFYGNLIDDWHDYSTQPQDHGIDFFESLGQEDSLKAFHTEQDAIGYAHSCNFFGIMTNVYDHIGKKWHSNEAEADSLFMKLADY